MKMRVDGINVGTVTPFKRDNTVDYEGIRQNLDFVLDAGVHTIEPVSSTGEGSLLTPDEYKEVVKATVDYVNGRVPVSSGAPGASPETIIRNLKLVKDLGSDGGYLSTPAYLLPTQKGMLAHFGKIFDSVDMPITVYNAIHRSGVELLPESVAKLAEEHSNFVAYKEQSLLRILQVKNLVGIRLQLIVEDWFWLPCMSIGVNGVQSVVGSIFPRLMVEMYNDFKNGNVSKALQTQIQITPLMEPLGVGIGGNEPNPSPLKAILNMLGRPAGDPRLPLVPASEELKALLKTRLIQVDPTLKSKLK